MRTISLPVAAGTVDGLGLLKSGALVKAVVVVDEAYEGRRSPTRSCGWRPRPPRVTETIATRLFARQNIAAIQVTPPAAQASGAWFGGNSFEAEFAKLWGVG